MAAAIAKTAQAWHEQSPGMTAGVGQAALAAATVRDVCSAADRLDTTGDRPATPCYASSNR